MSILVLHEGELDPALLGALTQCKASFEVVEDLQQATAILEPEDGPSTVVVDFGAAPVLAQDVALATTKLGRAKPYVLLLTDKVDDPLLQQLLHEGADDFVQKPVSAVELSLRLDIGARWMALRQRQETTRSHLRFSATHDALTGAWNKAAIVGWLYRESVRAAREGSDFSVLMCDLDHFKAINDTHGHLAGDDVLRHVAARLQNLLRPYDLVGRYGGEEFLVLLPGCGGARALEIAERVRRKIGSEPFPSGEKRVSATLSIGLATLSDVKRDARTPAEPTRVLDAADRALYRAKAQAEIKSHAVTTARRLRFGRVPP